MENTKTNLASDFSTILSTRIGIHWNICSSLWTRGGSLSSSFSSFFLKQGRRLRTFRKRAETLPILSCSLVGFNQRDANCIRYLRLTVITLTAECRAPRDAAGCLPCLPSMPRNSPLGPIASSIAEKNTREVTTETEITKQITILGKSKRRKAINNRRPIDIQFWIVETRQKVLETNQNAKTGVSNYDDTAAKHPKLDQEKTSYQTCVGA